MYKSNLISKLISAMLTLSLLGVFAFPAKASADFSISSVLSNFGINLGGSYNSSNSYDYNSLSSNDQGDLEMGKVVRDASRNSGFHESINIQSGSLVEVSIEVRNTSSRYDADVTVTDELGYNSVYVINSLTVSGATFSGGLTTGGLRARIPKKSKITITYRLNVCSGSTSPLRAYAYAPGVGSATDATRVQTETVQYGYSQFVSACVNSFQNNSNTTYSNNSTSSNPFGTWTGVNNSNSTTSTSSNPFGGWTGVNNANSTSASTNPFGTWTGVNNSNTTVNTNTNPFGDWQGVNNSNSTSTASTNPFGTWTGVNNSNNSVNINPNPFGTWAGVNNANSSSGNSSNPFGDWSGVNNSNNTVNTNTNPFGEWNGVNSNSNSNSSNPFGDWSGVNNSDGRSSGSTSSNPFGEWSGVNSNSNSNFNSSANTSSNSYNSGNPFSDWSGVNNTDSQYNASGYQTNMNSQNGTVNGANTEVQLSNTSSQPYRVAPTAGSDKFTPIIFAGLLTAAFITYKKRKLLFN